MTPNRTFWKAFYSLVHPLSLLAIILLLVNDHWLRYAHPSWLTGKLGDFTWLVFAPFIAALLFSWLIPRTWKRHQELVGWLSIGFIGVWFATAKTIPLVHEWTTQTLYAIVGWEGQLRLDVTDLLTLPALLISWYIWKNACDNPVSLKPLAYIAFGLGILGTLASDNTYYRDKGVYQICEHDGKAVIETTDINGLTDQYRSLNNGLFWEYVGSYAQYMADEKEINNIVCDDKQVTQLTLDDGTMLRWTPDQSIESSTDGGQTWVVENDLHEIRQEVRQHYIRYGKEDYAYLVENLPSPADVYYDEDSGNVLFAMSHFGVLVREPDGEYTWVTVDDYGLDNLLNFEKMTDAIFFELWLALATIFLIVTSSAVYMRRPRGKIKTVLIVISWIGYFGILGTLFTERMDDIYLTYFSLTALLSFFMLILFGIPLSIGATYDILANFRSVAIPIALAGLGNGLLFIFPFFLWTQARIPSYSTAFAFSIFLTLMGLYATRVYLKRILPVLEPEKGKRDAVEKAKAE
jgi:hypothetical protein